MAIGRITQDNPSIIIFDHLSPQEIIDLGEALSYQSKTKQYDLTRLKNNHFLRNKVGGTKFASILKEAEKKILINLLNQNELGYWFTYSGFFDLLITLGFKITNEIKYPDPKLIPWLKTPEYKPRYYQEESVDKLLKIKHGAIELATGSGKSIVLLELIKRLGLKTILMAPTESICLQLYELFCKYLGKKWVGMFGAGKKTSDKLFTVAIGASLTRLNPGDPHWDNLSEVSVFAVDEAHLAPADTLEKVCMGLCAKASYRFFVSGTQIRNDGGDLKLKGIIGPIVYTLHSEPLINQGVLARPFFYFITVNSNSSVKSKDPMKMIRAHYLYNSEIYKKVSKLVTSLHDKKILILIDELDQFDKLALELPNLTSREFLACGGSDTSSLIKRFNSGQDSKYRILVGTDAISTGSNLFCDVLIMIQGGKSPIGFRQAIGRGLRTTETKKEVLVFDFDVENIDIIHRHTEERLEIYRSIYDNIKILNDF